MPLGKEEKEPQILTSMREGLGDFLLILKEKRNQQDVSSLLLNPTLTTGIQLIFNSEKPSENTQKLSENE